MTQYDNLPKALKEDMHYCCWRYEDRGGKKPTKVPYNPITGKKAHTNNPHTFSSFNSALSKVKEYDGLGFLVIGGICAADLDNCFEENGSLKPWAKDIVDRFSGCYIERSPSGKGLRIIFKAIGYVFNKSLYYINNQKLGFEIYISGATNRFVTVTGDVFCNGDVLEKGDVLQEILDMYMKRTISVRAEQYIESQSYLSDESVLEKAMSSG